MQLWNASNMSQDDHIDMHESARSLQCGRPITQASRHICADWAEHATAECITLDVTVTSTSLLILHNLHQSAVRDVKSSHSSSPSVMAPSLDGGESMWCFAKLLNPQQPSLRSRWHTPTHLRGGAAPDSSSACLIARILVKTLRRNATSTLR